MSHIKRKSAFNHAQKCNPMIPLGDSEDPDQTALSAHARRQVVIWRDLNNKSESSGKIKTHIDFLQYVK